MDKIKEQMINCICRIKIGKQGTGFFIKFKDRNNNFIKVLMTNYHILGIDILNKDNDRILYYIYNNKSKEEDHTILDLKDRRKYFNEILDITIIEIKERDGINENQYSELEEDINFKTSIEEEKKILNINTKIIVYMPLDFLKEENLLFHSEILMAVLAIIKLFLLTHVIQNLDHLDLLLFL